MMEYKPGGGYDGDGYTNPKKQSQKESFIIAGFLAIIFGVAALAFGWWSLIFDVLFFAFLVWVGKFMKANKRA